MVRQLILVIIFLSCGAHLSYSKSIFSAIDHDDDNPTLQFDYKATIALLNKNTGKRNVIFLNINERKIIDNLSIILYKTYADYNNKVYGAYIKISNQLSEYDPQQIFSGWILYPYQHASSLSHPIYEVIVLSVK